MSDSEAGRRLFNGTCLTFSLDLSLIGDAVVDLVAADVICRVDTSGDDGDWVDAGEDAVDDVA